MNNQFYNKNNIIGYCIYCKDAIYKGEKYIVDEEEYFLHKVCDKQKNTFYDPYDFYNG